jgi:hypothetical protein
MYLCLQPQEDPVVVVVVVVSITLGQNILR